MQVGSSSQGEGVVDTTTFLSPAGGRLEEIGETGTATRGTALAAVQQMDLCCHPCPARGVKKVLRPGKPGHRRYLIDTGCCAMSGGTITTTGSMTSGRGRSLHWQESFSKCIAPQEGISHVPSRQ